MKRTTATRTVSPEFVDALEQAGASPALLASVRRPPYGVLTRTIYYAVMAYVGVAIGLWLTR